MRAVYLAAGAAGMYCGSCMRDNRLAATLLEQGRDVVLMPLYTPLRTDEADVSTPEVFFGGINVYLQQHSSIFRHTPRLVDRMLDSPALLNGVGKFAAKTKPEELGALTVSMLRGNDGLQRKEVDRLIGGLRDLRPDVINLPNLMFLGVARPIKDALGVPVLCTLSGEDIFLDDLPEPYRAEAFALISDAAADVDAFISVTEYFADHAARHFHVPRDRTHVIPMGSRLDDFATSQAMPRAADVGSAVQTAADTLPRGDAGSASRPAGLTIAYLARICPQKGLHVLADAWVQLRRAGRDCRLRAAGYLSAADEGYLQAVRDTVARAGFQDDFTYEGELSRHEKIDFLHASHVVSVPTVYPEAKGFYVLEAMAAGKPVVQPRHGSFPELMAATGGGLLYDPQDVGALVESLATLLDDGALRDSLGRQGRSAVLEKFNDKLMAGRTWALYEQVCAGSA